MCSLSCHSYNYWRKLCHKLRNSGNFNYSDLYVNIWFWNIRLETRWNCNVCHTNNFPFTIKQMPQKYNLNICRSGATTTNYVVPTTDNSAAGSYTCSVTVSTITSTDSTGYAVTATGLFFDMVCEIYLHVFH